MTSSVAEVSFAAELVTMLVALAGLVLMVRGREVAARSRPAQVVSGAGFVLLGIIAFLHGSTVVASATDAPLAVSRLLACVLILGGSVIGRPAWPSSEALRASLVGGLSLIVAAAIVELAGASETASSVLLGIGAVAVGLPIAAAGRRYIATRVAIASAGTLLLVLVVVAIAMSQVISSSVENTDLSRMAERATVQGYTAADQVNEVVKGARYAANDLIGFFALYKAPNPLAVLATGSQETPFAQAEVKLQVSNLSGLYPVGNGGYGYIAAHSSVVLSNDDINPVLAATARVPGVVPDTCSGNGQGRFVVVGGKAYAIGVYVICPTGSSTVLGTVVSLEPLDDAYLAQQRRPNPSVALALVAGGQTVASSGPSMPDAQTLATWASRAAGSGTSSTATVDGHFVAVETVTSAGSSRLEVVASSTESALVDTREKLFRTLFLVALGSAVVALALAVIVGERITSGVRRLTDVVGRVQASPETAALPRSGSVGADEVGVLGRAFDSMIDEVEARTADLRTAADDETRLRNRLEAVVAGISDGVVAVDVTGRVIQYNAAAERLLGVAAADALGTAAAGVIVAHGADGARLAERLEQPTSPTWEVETELRAAGGAGVPVTISAGAIQGPSGEIVGSVLVLRDLRSERALEQMKTEFLSRVGHELRTPLTGIMGYADILSRRSVEPERAHKWHTEILGSARRLLRIVEMLEFFASADAGRVRLRLEPLEPGSLVAGISAKWATTLGTGHQVARRIQPDAPAVLADRRWLVMALDELLDNAAKFSPAGGRIAICAGAAGSPELDRTIDELLEADHGPDVANGSKPGIAGLDPAPADHPNGSGGPGTAGAGTNGSGSHGSGSEAVPVPLGVGPGLWVEIAVVDQGEGMTPEQQAEAFGEFVQVDASDTRRFGGLGLGLALVKRVVEGHGGTVECRSVVGHGSAFVLRLPTAPTAAGARPGEPAPPDV